MKLLCLTTLLLVCFPLASAQVITNVRSETRNGRTKILHDLQGSEAVDIAVQTADTAGSAFKPEALSGDLKDVEPGTNKTNVRNPRLEDRSSTGRTNGVQVDVDSLGIYWVLVEGGSCQIGSDDGRDDEKPVHRVTLSTFWISRTEITFDQFDRFCDSTGRVQPFDFGWGRGNRPVINVTWEDAIAYTVWASEQSGKDIRLPTEAEWEYAASGGNKSRAHKFSGSEVLSRVGWFNGNSDGETHEVGTLEPNELGIWDMSGNAMEWCFDWYDGKYYSASPTDNPRGPSRGLLRVIRGGSWLFDEPLCRVTARTIIRPDDNGNVLFIGFRIVQN